jgi:hypothetical protein
MTDKVADVKAVNGARWHPRAMPRLPISKVMVTLEKERAYKAD